MKATNKLELAVLEMVEKGVDLHGEAREIYIDMLLREKEEADASSR